MKLYDELIARGLIAQCTNESEVAELINNGKATFYIGYDPTADSLTAGHALALIFMRRMQLAGNRPIILMGGATTLIGDPSGRTDMRKMLTYEQICANAEIFKGQMSRLLDFGEGGAEMVNNADWLLGLNYVRLLQEVGLCFSVNRMLAADCYKNRMEHGLSFLEFNYMVMQSYDFYHLYQTHGCIMQCGGDDQWSNILGGRELVRRKLDKEAHGLTLTLLVDGQGVKMGKTAGNALWLDPNKTSPFEFFQYWRNVDDASVVRCLKMLTFVPVDEIDAMPLSTAAEINGAKERLAYEVTAIIHGTEAAQQALATARELFTAGGVSENMPTTHLAADAFTGGGIAVCDLLVACGLAPSKGEAKRLIIGGGVSIDDRKITAFDEIIPHTDFGDGLIIKKGKKTYHRVVV